MFYRNLPTTFLFIVGFLYYSCSTTNEGLHCDVPKAVSLSAASCIIVDEDLHQELVDEMLASIQEVWPQIQEKMPTDQVLITIHNNPSATIREIGIGGRNPDPNRVILSIDPGFPEIMASIRNELPSLLAHEIHHAKRRRHAGYGSTLLEAMISEGLADAFSIEVTHINPPPWSNALADHEIVAWMERSQEEWYSDSYNHYAWFFGTDETIPRWTGYTLGFRLVEEYLQKNNNDQPSDLYDEAASSFVQ